MAPFDYNECAVPTTGTPQPPATSCPIGLITINGVTYGSVASGGTEDIAVVDGFGTPVGSLVSGNWVVTASCPNATAVLKNTAGTTISTTSIASGASSNITAPDASAVLKNTLNTTLSTTSILSNGSSNITAPDSTITINSAAFSPYPSGATSNIVVKDSLGTAVGSKVGSEWIVPTNDKTLIYEFNFQISTTDIIATVTADMAGTFTATTNDGSSGTITFSKNGGSFVAFSSPLVLATSDTLAVKRTTSTALGWVKINGTYA
jgi:hypothetical protein